MLTTRSLLLTLTGLFTGFAAAAQSAPAAGPQPTDVLSWVTWWLAGVVLLMAIITGASATAAAQRRYQDSAAADAAPAAPASTLTVVPSTLAPSAQPTPAAQPARPATTPEAVAA